MPSLKDVYLSNLNKQFKYRANWLPNSPLKLGAVGKLDDGEFHQFTTLQELGIPFEPINEVGVRLKFTSDGVTSVEVKADVATTEALPSLPNASAGIKLSFKKEKSIFLETQTPTISKISNLAIVEREVLRQLGKGYNKDWVFVTEIVEVEAGTVIVSKNAGSEIVLSGKGSTGPIDVAEAGVTVTSSSVVGTEVVGAKMSPLYKVRGIKGTGFLHEMFGGDASIEVVRGAKGLNDDGEHGNGKDAAEFEFDEVPYSEKETKD